MQEEGEHSGEAEGKRSEQDDEALRYDVLADEECPDKCNDRTGHAGEADCGLDGREGLVREHLGVHPVYRRGYADVRHLEESDEQNRPHQQFLFLIHF